MTVKQRYKITIRGYQILAKYCPGLIESKTISAAIESISPFINIWFSAKIINEISKYKRVNMLGIYVIMIVVINFVLLIIKNVVDRISGVKEASMWNCFSKIFCDICKFFVIFLQKSMSVPENQLIFLDIHAQKSGI